MSNFHRRQIARVQVSDPGDEIVISGISGRFPKSRTVADLSHNLYNKIDMVDANDSRFKNVNDELPGRYGLTVDIDKFDAPFFSINHRLAQNMDPQQRIIQEHAFESIMDAGICPKQIRGSRTAVFVGCCIAESDEYLLFNNNTKDGSGMLGSSRCMLANRISFSLDLKGPSFQLDSACSSSGYALDMAFSAIRNGECDAAIVGGTNLITHDSSSIQFARLGLLAKDGVSCPFDENAHGYVRAESISALFLQKRKDAKRVYATVVYSKTNVDGFKNEGITFPSSHVQTQLFREVYQDIGIHPKNVDYVEAHSTSTVVGDPEECSSIDRIFCSGREGPLRVGSIKSNLGHAEAAASNNGVIKSVLIFENGKIPPNLNLKKIRQDIPSLAAGRIKPVTEVEDFDGSLIGINSFGFGGANSHVLLRRNSKEKVNGGIPTDNLPRLIVWSGRTEEAVNAIFDSVTKKPLDAEYVGLLHNTQISTISSNIYRGYAIYNQEGEASNAACAERHITNFGEARRPTVWVYSGMGSQWPGMGADLMKIPIFENSIRRCHDILAKKGIDLINIITSKDPTIFDNILHSFVGISAIQIGLTNVLKAVGLEPDYIIGHSFGELGCAYADNCLTEEEMILSSYSRGKTSIEINTIHGSMAAVGIGYKELKSMLDDGIEIACHNSSDSCTISGPVDIVAQFIDKLKKKNIFAKEVQCSNIAYHSSYIAEFGSQLLESLKPTIQMPKQRSQKWISTSVPKSDWDSIECRYSSAQYHTNNLLNPVLFEEGCENLPKNALTIEIAPHGLLQAIMKRTIPEGNHFSLTKRGSDQSSMLLYSALGRLFENGVDLDLTKLYPAIEFPVSRGTPMISPSIKWDHKSSLFVSSYKDKQHNQETVKLSLTDPDYEFISGHEIDGRILFPATGYLFLAWKLLAAQCLENFRNFDVEFEDVKFIRACHIQKNQEQDLNVILHRGTGQFEVSEGSSTLVTGIVRPCDNYQLTDIDDDANDVLELKSSDFYKELRLRGYQYKNLFRSVMSAKMDSSSGMIKWQSNWVAFLDCLLQLQIVSKNTRSLALPIGIKKIVIKKKDHEKLMAELGENPIVEAKYSADLNLLRCGGVEIRGLMAQAVSRRPPKGIPVLESHEFVPHFPTPSFSKADIGRFCVQLALENDQIAKISCLELDVNDDREPLCEYFGLAVSDLPLVTAELNYLTTKDIEIPLTNVSNGELSEFSNQTFVIKSNCLFDADFLENIKKYISDNSYIISRESKDCEIFDDYEGSQGYKIVAVIPSETETLVMIQYKKVPNPPPTSIIKITNTDQTYSWLEILKKKAKTEPTLLYAERESHSGILGLVNCIRKEPSGSGLRCVFIDDDSAPAFNIGNPFYKSQLDKDLAINVYRNGKWGSLKHFLVKPSYDKVSYEDSCYANGLVRGDLSSIKWLKSPLTVNSDNIVNVQYAALNFRDVMLATGKLSAETMGDNRLDLMCLMGIEFAGVTKGGRRLMGMKSAGALATHVEADETLSWEVPASWSLEEAVTVPCVYATVYAAFFITTKIQKGKSILIHAGSGGVGLAAIRVAFAYGLEVYTTVSTEDKKNYLLSEFPELKRENIGNSRSTSFEDMIKKRTRGKGVDFVLNSLAEEKLAASVRCLGKGGKFLEIGKFDMANDNKLSLGDFLRELTFHAVLVDNMFKAPIEEKLTLKKLLDDDMARGIIKPLKTNVFNADEIENAFRFLASGKHIGKVVLKIRESENDKATLPISVLPRVYCNPYDSYIICGGLGGFGLELADWLILRGCRKLVLSTSRGITKPYQSYRIQLFESCGVQVEINKADICTRQGCEQLISDALKLGKVGGIFNLAVQLRDSILENQTVTTFDECMAPKAAATKYLDDISRAKCPNLQYFVVFSSVSCGRGNAGQSNYGMANSVMERIMEERHYLGLPAKAIQWGAVGEVGIVADMQEDKIDMEIGGTLLQRISSCLEELDTLITVDSPIVASMVVAEKKYKGAGKGGVLEMLMSIMSIKDLKSFSIETKLAELGMDSLMTVEIVQTLERDFNITVTPQALRSMTVAEFKALETNGVSAVKESAEPEVAIDFLIKNFGDESTSHLTILKINDVAEDSNVKALVFPGIEGVGGQMFYDLAKELKYPAYLLQCTNIWNISEFNEMCSALIKDIETLYVNDSKFLFIGYSYGSILTLKLAKMLESLGKTGKVILIDGSPSVSKKILNDILSSSENVDQTIQRLVMVIGLKYAFPNDTSDRRNAILAEPSWMDKMKKFEELYQDDFEIFSKDYCFKVTTLIKNRVSAGYHLSLDDLPVLESPIKLIKPTEELVMNAEHDFGLEANSKSKIEVTTLEGNHLTILEHQETFNIINSTY
ncbi:fatty acid synthase-like [Chironomus tepperi]|uniref:fatty acid synthase-like n=1 Tax=Chironomus tepperi TaxID=113505 RepID=UPI00391F7B8E